MDNSLYHTIGLGVAFLGLFGLTELSYHLFKLKAEITRKIAHLATGLLSLWFPVLIDDVWYVFMLCFIFFILLIASRRLKYLSSVNAIDRDSMGSTAYPIAVFGCYLVYYYMEKSYIFFNLPILILAISDPLAALIGKQWPLGKYSIGCGEKTLMGSMAFFISASVLSFILLFPLVEIELVLTISLLIGLISTIVEGFSWRGMDNLTIPLSVIILLYTTLNKL